MARTYWWTAALIALIVVGVVFTVVRNQTAEPAPQPPGDGLQPIPEDIRLGPETNAILRPRTAVMNAHITPSVIRIFGGQKLVWTLIAIENGDGSGWTVDIPAFGISQSFAQGSPAVVEVTPGFYGSFRYTVHSGTIEHGGMLVVVRPEE